MAQSSYNWWPRRRVNSAAHQHDLFPLPFPPALSGSGNSVNAAKKSARRTRIWLTASEAISALSELYGCSSSASGPVSAGQDSALRNVLRLVAQADQPNQFTSNRAAFCELLGAQAYSGEATSVVPYRPSLVSLPSAGSSPVDLSQVS